MLCRKHDVTPGLVTFRGCRICKKKDKYNNNAFKTFTACLFFYYFFSFLILCVQQGLNFFKSHHRYTSTQTTLPLYVHSGPRTFRYTSFIPWEPGLSSSILLGKAHSRHSKLLSVPEVVILFHIYTFYFMYILLRMTTEQHSD